MRLLVLLPPLLLCACGSGNGAAIDRSGLTILPDDLPAGSPRTSYSVTLLGAGGAGSGYAWSLAEGALPPGLAGLPATGSTATLAGTPTLEGTFDFTVELSDSAGATTTMAYSLVVGTDGPGTGPGPGPGSGPGMFPTSLVNAPAPRGYHTAVWTGIEMIVWGGLDFVGRKNTGGAYDPVADTWRTLPTAGAPSARIGHTVVWTGSEMIVWGGSDDTGVVDTGAAYNPGTDTWRAISNSGAPERRSGHSAVWTGSAMIVWGGVGVSPRPTANSVDRVLGDGFAYDPVTDAWTPIATPTGLTARAHCAVWTGTSMIVWGGLGAAGYLADGGAYDPAADTWTAMPVIASARARHTAVWTGTSMIVWGGATAPADTYVDSGAVYTP